jgi:V8-like Glu-specific endopeptidase
MAPGAAIALVGEYSGSGCTLGSGIRAGDRTGFLTAGHCGTGDGDMVRLDSVTGAPLGVLSDADDSYDSVAKVALDYAAVWTSAPTPGAATVAGLPVAGVMTREAAAKLPKGTPICFDGATSDLSCAPLRFVDSITMRLDGAARPGDSGSPAFVVDGDTGAATLIGIMSGGDASNAEITYLDPALDRLGAQALVDSAAAATVAGDPRYSERVAPLS